MKSIITWTIQNILTQTKERKMLDLDVTGNIPIPDCKRERKQTKELREVIATMNVGESFAIVAPVKASAVRRMAKALGVKVVIAEHEGALRCWLKNGNKAE